jgi:hypothetical protein
MAPTTEAAILNLHLSITGDGANILADLSQGLFPHGQLGYAPRASLPLTIHIQISITCKN